MAKNIGGSVVLKVYSETIKFPPNACRGEQPGVGGAQPPSNRFVFLSA